MVYRGQIVGRDILAMSGSWDTTPNWVHQIMGGATLNYIMCSLEEQTPVYVP